jgi:hypothetical protein
MPGDTCSIKLSWTPPTTRTDGSSLAQSEIAGYRIFRGATQSDLVEVENVTGNATTYEFSNVPAGTYYFALKAYDVDGNESDFSNVVEKVCTPPVDDNRPPVIAGTPAPRVVAGENYSFTPTAMDPDGDQLTFSVVNLPSWASFDTDTGTLSGTPAESDVNSYPGIEIRVSDGVASDALAPFTLTVDMPADTGSVKLSWTPPTTRTDGSALAQSEIAGYRIYRGTSPSNLVEILDVPGNTVTAYEFTDVPAGTYYFALKAYDVDGNVSELSNVVERTVP